MRYRTFGRTGLRVSELALGTMTFGEDWGWGASKAESRRIFEAYAEAGGNLIDTANSYTNGTSERIIGELVGAERDRFVIATKYTHAFRMGDPNGSGNHRKSLVQSLEGSLRRLGTDHVDILWLHAWDFLTPVDEVMRSLDDVVRAGKALYVGVSDTPAWIAARANTLAELRGWTPFAGIQAEYSLIRRSAERELLPLADALGLCFTAWGPLGAGLLTGRYLEDGTGDGRLREVDMYHGVLSERNLGIAGVLAEVAGDAGATPAQVALGWLRSRGVVPIVGARTAEQLEDSLGVLDVELTDAQLARLDEVSAIPAGFPHDFLASDAVRSLVYGGMADRLDGVSSLRA